MNEYVDEFLKLYNICDKTKTVCTILDSKYL